MNVATAVRPPMRTRGYGAMTDTTGSPPTPNISSPGKKTAIIAAGGVATVGGLVLTGLAVIPPKRGKKRKHRTAFGVAGGLLLLLGIGGVVYGVTRIAAPPAGKFDADHKVYTDANGKGWDVVVLLGGGAAPASYQGTTTGYPKDVASVQINKPTEAALTLAIDVYANTHKDKV